MCEWRRCCGLAYWHGVELLLDILAELDAAAFLLQRTAAAVHHNTVRSTFQAGFAVSTTKGARATSTPVSSMISAPTSAIRLPTSKVSSSVPYPTST